MSADKRQKMLERVRKLLAMAEDVASPNEAAIAASRARKLMNEYNISRDEAEGSKFTLDDITEGNVGPITKRFPKWLSVLAVGVAKYSDCHARFGMGRRANGYYGKQIKFLGEATDLEVARYLFTYLQRTVEKLCKDGGFSKWPRDRANFCNGAASAIVDTLERMKAEERREQAESNGRALVIVDQKDALIASKYGVTRYSRQSERVTDGFSRKAGEHAGSGVSIRRAVNTGRGVRRIT